MNRIRYVLSLILTALTVLSCTHTTNTTAEQVAANTEIEALEYQPGTWVSGPKMGNRYMKVNTIFGEIFPVEIYLFTNWSFSNPGKSSRVQLFIKKASIEMVTNFP